MGVEWETGPTELSSRLRLPPLTSRPVLAHGPPPQFPVRGDSGAHVTGLPTTMQHDCCRERRLRLDRIDSAPALQIARSAGSSHGAGSSAPRLCDLPVSGQFKRLLALLEVLIVDVVGGFTIVQLHFHEPHPPPW